MTHPFGDRWSGLIRGLRLPLYAWSTLRDEGITTVDELKAIADQLERFPGIGTKTAQLIPDELARVSTRKRGSSTRTETT
jgi:Holliday junction resolvasome RuvABC DNA-binding subunit